MHNDIINQLSAYLDGELSGEERARVDAHVATCAACRVVLDDLKAIVVTAPYYEGEAPKRDPFHPDELADLLETLLERSIHLVAGGMKRLDCFGRATTSSGNVAYWNHVAPRSRVYARPLCRAAESSTA